MQRNIFIMAIAAIVAALVSFYLTLKRISYSGVDGLGDALCHISSQWDCDVVANSPASELFSLPVSWVGVVAYLFIFALLLLYARYNRSTWLELSLYVAVGVCILADVYFAWLMLVDIKAYCLFCIATYICSLVLLWCVVGMVKLKGGVKSLWYRVSFGDALKVVVVACLYIVAVFSGGEYLKAQERLNQLNGFDAAGFRSVIEGSRALQVDLRGDPSIGTGPLTVVEFSDFQCPYCAKSAALLRPVVEEFKDKIRFVFKNFPLGKACNPLLQNEQSMDLHPSACAIARLSEAAHMEGGFWKLHDYIFAHQAELMKTQLSMDEVEKLVLHAGLNWDAIEKHLHEAETSKAVMVDTIIGSQLGVRSTPTLLFNDVMLPGGVSPEVFRRMIEIYIDVLTVRQGNSE